MCLAKFEEITLSSLQHSEEMGLEPNSIRLTLTLLGNHTAVHIFQYQGHPLTKERPVSQVNITKLSELNEVRASI